MEEKIEDFKQIGSEKRPCKNEKQIIRAVKNGRSVIFAYGNIIISEKTSKLIKKNKVFVNAMEEKHG